jgi:hypothetical protein
LVPQQRIEASLITAQALSCPTLIWLTTAPTGRERFTRLAYSLAVFPKSPTWPKTLFPQQYTTPAEVRAQKELVFEAFAP